MRRKTHGRIQLIFILSSGGSNLHILLKNKISLLNSLLIFLLIFISALPFAFIGGDALHDGLMLKVAIDVWSGKMLFAQTYSYYGITSPIFHAFSLQILGEHLYAIRLATLFIYSLSGILLFFLWNKFTNKWISLIALIFWIIVAPYYYQIFYPWPSVFAMFFQTVTIFLYVLFLKKNNKFILILVGISACLTFFSKQSYALLFLSILMLEGIFLVLRINSRKIFIQNTFIVALAFTVTFLLIIFWLFINNALYDYWLQVIRQGYSVGKIVGGSFIHNFISYYGRHPFWLIIFISTFIVFLNSFWDLYRKRGDKMTNMFILSISFLSFSSFAQIYPTVDPSHTYWAIAPGFIFVFYLLYKISKRKNTIFVTMGIILISLILIIEPIYTMNRARIAYGENYYSLKNPETLNHMRMISIDAIFYSEINSEMETYLNKFPKRTFIIDNSDAIYSTFTNRTVNVLPIFANFSGYSSGYYNFDKAINDYVKLNKPLILVESININRFENYHVIRIWENQKLALVAPNEN